MSVFHSVMSLLPTTRVSTSNNIIETNSLPCQDEDILLVDFQPVVTNQLLSSPSTTTSTAMYPLPPPQIPGAHMIGLNHQPSISSDGITTPISATGSSGKVHSNPNNFSLVSLSNHAHHNNNTSREESDLNYPPPPAPSHHIHFQPGTIVNNANANNILYDEDDEFARHQALAQPSYMMNKRRTRRFTNRESHIWDNANHVGHLHQQAPHSSTLSSSEDSDTGFLMGTRKTAYTRRSVQRVVDPHPNTALGAGGNMSPSASTGLLPNLSARKRVRRRRPSARNRKPANNQRDKMPNPSDVLSVCCCLCEDDNARSGNHRSSSLRNRYFRLIFVLIALIGITILASVTASLQRKVDFLDMSLKKLDQALGSPLTIDSSSSNGEINNVHKSKESFDALVVSHNELNSTVSDIKSELNQTNFKFQDLQKQLKTVVSKQDGVSEIRDELAKLGSRVQELSSTILSIQESLDKLKKENEKVNNDNAKNNGNAGGNGNGSGEKDNKGKSGSEDSESNPGGESSS